MSSRSRLGQGSIQLAFRFVEEEALRGAQFVATRPLGQHRSCNTLLKRIYYVKRFFPELDGRTIRVGLTRVASGMAVPGGNELWFNPAQASHHAIAHEFVHLLQGEYGIPTGERSCDLFSLARHWTLNDTPPYYLRVPAELLTSDGQLGPEQAKLIFEVSRRALELRAAGVRNYISFFEKTLESLRERPPVSVFQTGWGTPG